MAEMLINNWGGGIGDDPFLNRNGECLDMDGIDIRTTPRKITAMGSFLGTNALATLDGNAVLNYVTETIDGVVQSYSDECYVGTQRVTTLTDGGSHVHISTGANLNDYNASSNPEGIRHIFFQYNNTTNPIIVIRKNGTGYATVKTESTSSIPNTRTTAVCYLWQGSIIFSRDNKIYEFNPSTMTLTNGVKLELEQGAIIKNIYYYNGQITIVYNIESTCYIRNATYDGTTYKLTYYADISPGEKCITSTHNRGVIYWVSKSGIHTYQGQSQIVRAYPFSEYAVCSYDRGIMRIGDGGYFYEFGTNKPGYGNPLTKISSIIPIKGVTQNFIVTFQNGINRFRIDQQSAGIYKRENHWISHPYTAGQFGWKKKGLGFLIGCTFPQNAYTENTLCEISIQIQTDRMEQTNSTVFNTIYTETDHTKRLIHITPNMVTNALGSYSDEWGYFRLKIILKTGDQSLSLYSKTPTVYDVYMTHTEIDNPFK